MLTKFKKSIPLAIGLGIIIFLILSIWSGWFDLVLAFKNFIWWTFFAALLCALANYLIRFLRWQFYLHLLEIAVPRKRSLMIFLAGLAFSITPGKFGELAKSWFLKDSDSLPISRTAPIVAAERLSDLIAVVILALVGISQFDFLASKVVVLVGVICLVCIILFANQRFTIGLIRLIKKNRRLGNIADKLDKLLSSFRQTILPGPMVVATLLGIFAWSFEAFGLWLILVGVGQVQPLLEVVGIYAIATTLGAIAMLPGGLGLTEISLNGALILVGVSKSAASAATLLIRASTLWFAVLIGSAALFVYSKKKLTPA